MLEQKRTLNNNIESKATTGHAETIAKDLIKLFANLHIYSICPVCGGQLLPFGNLYNDKFSNGKF